VTELIGLDVLRFGVHLQTWGAENLDSQRHLASAFRLLFESYGTLY